MASGPSSSQGCSSHSCRQLAIQLEELQERVSLLTTIHLEDQRHLESLLSAAQNGGSPPPCVTALPGKVRHGSLGARPKLSCSTPLPPPPQAWSKVPRHKRRGWHSRLSPPSSEPIPTANRFEALESLDPPHCSPRAKKLRPGRSSALLLGASQGHLGAPPQELDEVVSSTPSSLRRPGTLHITPNPKRSPPTQAWEEVMQHTGHAGLRSLPAAAGGPPTADVQAADPMGSTSDPAPPSVLVIGSSMVRHIVVPKAQTCCFPGAKVLDVRAAIPPLLTDHPQASSLIIHVGTNDIKLQQSERLKEDFKALISTAQETGRSCIISGPFSSPRYGDGKFSRIRQLHIWLKGYCCQHNIPFVDNFTTFLYRPDLFAMDGLHPSWSGARLLSMNMDLALRSSSV